MTEKVKAPKNIKEMRTTLTGVFADLCNGDVNVKAASEISNMAGKVTSSIKAELEYAKLREEKPDIDFLNVK